MLLGLKPARIQDKDYLIICVCSMYKVLPDTKQFFTRVNGDNIYSAKFTAHSQRVLGGVDICIALLDDPATLNAQLSQLQAQHIDRKITSKYFEVSIGLTINSFRPK